MKYSISIKRMTDDQVTEIYEELLIKLSGIPLEGNQMRYLLSKFTEVLDDTDPEDMFGTEGWRHYFRLE